MSTINFTMLDRIVLTPMEINPAMKMYPWYAAAVLLLFGLQPSGILFKEAWSGGEPFLAMGLVVVLAGAFVTPVLLPFVPFRSFAIKGWIVGILFTVLAVQGFGIVESRSWQLLALTYLFYPALTSYIALQFTGSTTYTGMSGVKRELKIGIPIYIGTAAASLALLVMFKLNAWGLI